MSKGDDTAPSAPAANVLTITPEAVAVAQAIKMTGSNPVTVSCPYCHATGVTDIEEVSGACSWITCAVLCLLGLWCCACIPFCVKDCQEIHHSCSNCKRPLGVKKP